jgi:hypothetical protein
MDSKSAQGCSSPWLLHQEIENQCWVVLYFLWRTSGCQFWKINYNCISVSILHINGTENPVLSLHIQKHKFWIWFWKSDLVLIHFILTQTRTNSLMQVNLWVSPILITIFIFIFFQKHVSQFWFHT